MKETDERQTFARPLEVPLPEAPIPVDRMPDFHVQHALQLDSRLRRHAAAEAGIERQRAAVARELYDRPVSETFGYAHRRDFAREELGMSIRTWQDLARLDRALNRLPLTDREFSSGRLLPSHVLTLLPVLEPENEAMWLRQVRRCSVREIRKRVEVALRLATSESSDRVGSEDDSMEGRDLEILVQREPGRTRIIWEAFTEEAERRTGHALNDGQTLEVLLAEFWSAVPPEVAAKIYPKRVWPPAFCSPLVSTPPPSADSKAYLYSDEGEQPDPWLDRARFEGRPQSFPVAVDQTDGSTWVKSPVRSAEAWREDRRLKLEQEYHHAWKDLDQKARDWGCDPEVEVERVVGIGRESLCDLSDQDLLRYYHALRKRHREIAAEEGAWLYLLRKRRYYLSIDFDSFAHYVSERLGMSRRAAENHATLHGLTHGHPRLWRAYQTGEFFESQLLALRRLLRLEIAEECLDAWIDRARESSVKVFVAQVRYVEARLLRNTVAASEAFPPEPDEWQEARRRLNPRPELLSVQSFHRQMSARPEGGEAESKAESKAESGAEFCPDPEERPDRIAKISAPREVLESYKRAIALLRALYGTDMPAWWCREVMMLQVLGEWNIEAREFRRRIAQYDIYERDGFQCAVPTCTSRRNLSAHHIRFRSRGGSDDPSNRITLCEACHQQGVHEGGWIRVTGTAPDRLRWEMGSDGTGGPWRVF